MLLSFLVIRISVSPQTPKESHEPNSPHSTLDTLEKNRLCSPDLIHGHKFLCQVELPEIQVAADGGGDKKLPRMVALTAGTWFTILMRLRAAVEWAAHFKGSA